MCVRDIKHLQQLNSLILQVKPLIKGAIHHLSVLEHLLRNYTSLTGKAAILLSQSSGYNSLRG